MHEGFHLGLRVTARITFVFFALAFAGESALRLWPGGLTEWVARQRDRWTLGIALSHSVHLGLILGLVAVGGFAALEVPVVGVVLGGVVFLLIYLLALGAVMKRGPLYASGFRTTMMYLLWVIFALTFVGGLVKSLVYLPLAVAVLGAMGVRLAARFARMRAVTN